MITITDVNEPPTVALANTTTTFPEDTDTTSSAIKVADIVITDDALGTNTNVIEFVRRRRRAVSDRRYRTLFLVAGASVWISRPTRCSTSLSRSMTLQLGATPDDTAPLTITITDVNEPPTVALANTTTTFPEDTDTSSAIKVADIVITDDAL